MLPSLLQNEVGSKATLSGAGAFATALALVLFLYLADSCERKLFIEAASARTKYQMVNFTHTYLLLSWRLIHSGQVKSGFIVCRVKLNLRRHVYALQDAAPFRCTALPLYLDERERLRDQPPGLGGESAGGGGCCRGILGRADVL